ncbi:TRAP transporter small permease [Chelativorans alearense]|uniref:TRAP transporter small permease n=1 Tax=Chelativorans alearense TaxID=2681495 RepID=UPI0013D45240|nr:TRAP transporter small permease subunit [Chelativorans alearense]
MKHAVDKLMQYLLVAIALGLIATVFLSVYNVVARYVFGAALLWADEAAVFYMIVMTYVGAVVCAWQQVDIRMSVVMDILPPRASLVLQLVQEIAVAAVLYWVAWLSYGYVSRLFAFGMTSDALGIPSWVVHSAITLSMVAMAVISTARVMAGLADMRRPGRARKAEADI